MDNKKLFCLFLLLVFSFIATPLHAQDPPQATVFLSPTTTTLAVGERKNVTIVTSDVQDLYGFDISLTFTNPDTIEIVDADANTEGVQVGFGPFLEPDFTLHNQVDHSAGTIRFAMTQVNPSPPKNGRGVLMIITLRGLKPSASTELTLTHVEQAQPRGIMLPTTIDPTPAQLHITQNLQAQVTSTVELPLALIDSSANSTPIPPKYLTTSPQESFILATIQASLVFLLLLLLMIVLLMVRQHYNK